MGDTFYLIFELTKAPLNKIASKVVSLSSQINFPRQQKTPKQMSGRHKGEEGGGGGSLLDEFLLALGEYLKSVKRGKTGWCLLEFSWLYNLGHDAQAKKKKTLLT